MLPGFLQSLAPIIDLNQLDEYREYLRKQSFAVSNVIELIVLYRIN